MSLAWIQNCHLMHTSIYMLTVGRVLITNVFQINSSQLLSRVKLHAHIYHSSWNGQLRLPKSLHKWAGLIHEWKHTLLAPCTSPPYAGKQLTVLFHTQPPFTTLVHRCAAATINCIFWLKPSPALKASGHQLGLVYGHETWAYPTNTALATTAFLLLLDTNLLSEADITSWYTLY